MCQGGSYLDGARNGSFSSIGHVFLNGAPQKGGCLFLLFFVFFGGAIHAGPFNVRFRGRYIGVQNMLTLGCEALVNQGRHATQNNVAGCLHALWCIPISHDRPLRGKIRRGFLGKTLGINPRMNVDKAFQIFHTSSIFVGVDHGLQMLFHFITVQRVIQEFGRNIRVRVGDHLTCLDHFATFQLHARGFALLHENLRHVTIDVNGRLGLLFHSSHKRLDNSATASLGKVQSHARSVPIGQHVGNDGIHGPRSGQALQQKAKHIQPVLNKFVLNLHFFHDIAKGLIEGLTLRQCRKELTGVFEQCDNDSRIFA
mmetsp:Transcript_17261/g.47201  ORF Transcript_17261/g.47201 Transcript_17261/m.47201 type:complete len:312 (+) Transcript_17261:285-1220(+)